jgi:serine protease AprX
VTVSGADGVTVSGADGTTYKADSIVLSSPNGVTVSGADGVTVSGADGVTVSGVDGVTVSGADGVTVSGVDGVTVSGADSIAGFNSNGVLFEKMSTSGVTISGADGVTISGADGVTVSGADGVTVSGADSSNTNQSNGLQSVDPELALLLSKESDDSNINAIIAYHQSPTAADLDQLRQIGILGGTKFNILPFIIVTATRAQLIEVSQLSNVRSLYGNRTLDFNSDPFYKNTGIERVPTDRDLQNHNAGMPVSGKNVTVAVLDTGVNSQHNDLADKVVQNVRLADTQSAPAGFVSPSPVENIANTDPVSGHGTFVAGVIAASGISSGGKYNGVAPGANILGLSAGDINLTHVLSGFDYVLEKRADYNVRVINCSFSANTVYDEHDPVNIATKLLTENNINVVFSAGNTGAGNGTLNPYASAPWVISVGTTDEKSRLAGFSSRGVFGSSLHKPSLVAPGVNVVSLRSFVSQTGVLGVAGGADSNRLQPSELAYYTTASGTSFSAPQVAGAIALMLEANPDLTPANIKDILQRSATPLPNYYGHEVGAGMLNTHAAVLEAAFPDRKTGLFRSILSNNKVSFNTYVSQQIEGNVTPGTTSSNNIQIPANTIQATVNIAWGNILTTNDLGLKVFDSNNSLIGESNYLNVIGLTGKREKVVINDPGNQTFRAEVKNTLPVGTSQKYFGALEVTTVDYPNLRDLDTLSDADRAVVLENLRSFMMLPLGRKFRTDRVVSRRDFAEAIVRNGLVPQYVAADRMFTDVKDLSLRSVIESVQSNPNGKIFYDAQPGEKFDPNRSVDRLTASVALVRAANLEHLVAGNGLAPTVSDLSTIPNQFRGFVKVALDNGLLTLQGNNFNPNNSITRLDLARALVKIKRRSN